MTSAMFSKALINTLPRLHAVSIFSWSSAARTARGCSFFMAQVRMVVMRLSALSSSSQLDPLERNRAAKTKTQKPILRSNG
jgi:hypothetical protein